MFTWLGFICLVLAGSHLVIGDQGPLVRLDNAVGYHPRDVHLVDIEASRNLKDFIGSTNGSLTSFLGIPFAKPPYASLITTRSYCVLTLVQYRKQAFQPR
jgi:hypothetical protein